ncbi:AraC-type DNA-binding protein [Friedmanniella luteola]|uniref:AraC-type DNA-binding protein n=1 Tax=Friedmanniella luteola TaxID=546871 RepID=A0A1H1PH19_9ACTN|nr:helix-turn-helix domain-containing protein [Friedmanniella luteola]SDS10380.1 AraC-type DNA-binding protein [Friedmanniella luteola]
MHLWRPPRAAALRPFVDSVEYVEDTPATLQERMVPGGGISLVVMLREAGFTRADVGGPQWVDGACLTGAQQHAQVVSTAPQRGMVAVNFAPGGAAPFVPFPLHAATGGYPSLGEVWGREGELVRERMAGLTPDRMLDLAEEILLSHAVGELTRDRALDLALRSLDAGAPVGVVVERFGTTAKPFIRRFRAATGLTPKTYARLRRLQRVLHSLPPDGRVDWSRIAADQGYHDQSHLIHDFKAITGLTPSQYRPRSVDAPNHLPC